ncbi:hypothetical protein GFS31_09510 [Leptolyngbya sp. BL0902]|nr:hypothetical protein GFS31_09510 [Leptolyngbya sp. BL0902]
MLAKRTMHRHTPKGGQFALIPEFRWAEASTLMMANRGDLQNPESEPRN